MSSQNDRLVAFCLVALWAVYAIWSHWGVWSVDLSALYYAGVFFGEGGSAAIYNRVYDTPEGLKWVEYRDAAGHAGKTIAPFVYPPWVAGVVSSTARSMDAQAFFNIGYVVNISALAASILLAGRLARPDAMPWLIWVAVTLAIFFISFPVAFSVELNQPQNFVNFLVFAAFVCVVSKRDFAGGSLLAVAAAIKLSPAVFAIIFLFDRNWRALGGFAAAGLAMVALNFAITPAGYTAGFLDTVSGISAEAFLSRINHSVELVLYCIWAVTTGAGIPEFIGYTWVPAPAWIDPVVKAGLLGTVLWVMFLTRNDRPQHRLWFQLQLVAMMSFLFGPLSWTHYLIFPMLLLPGITHILPSPRGWIALVAIALAFSTALMMPLLSLEGRELIPAFWGFFWCLIWVAILLWARKVAQE